LFLVLAVSLDKPLRYGIIHHHFIRDMPCLLFCQFFTAQALFVTILGTYRSTISHHCDSKHK
ncbi:hypothetical protein, partial [uncultured Parabacteroides sp.]|uniref:hypothetical protein n=1 Tax=uncultured Parabacteroides sp. TaxID=512312 RepID=UPI00272A2E9B